MVRRLLFIFNFKKNEAVYYKVTEFFIAAALYFIDDKKNSALLLGKSFIGTKNK